MLLSLDGRGPRYTQITRALVSQVRHGALAPGSRAPSTRELARDTGCSRNVVLLAYEQLLIEGYFVSRQREGTFVAAGVGTGARVRRCAGAQGASQNEPEVVDRLVAPRAGSCRPKGAG